MYLSLVLTTVVAIALATGPESDSDIPHDDLVDHTSLDEENLILATFIENSYKDYEKMPLLKREEKFKEKIPEMDTDKNKRISKEEFAAWFLRFVEEDTLKSDIKEFEHIDENKDGKFTLEELHKDFQIQQTKDNIDEKIVKRNEEKLKLRFEAADKNKDGFLSNEEMIKFLFNDHFRELHGLQEKMFLIDFDANRDGTITREEFEEYAKFGVDNQTLAYTLSQFDDFDKNQDGNLTAKEVEAIATFLHTFSDLKREIEEIFDLADTEKKGSVTYDELAKQHEYFTDRSKKLPAVMGQEIDETLDENQDTGEEEVYAQHAEL